MATVIRQERKKGVNYRIQVPIKDFEGNYKTATTTWTPPPGLSKIDQDKQAAAFAYEFEKKQKQEKLNPVNVSDSVTLREYSPVFLEQMEKHTSASYHSACLINMPTILESLGNYRLNELKPLVIQNFIDNLHKRTFEVVYLTAKPTLKERIAEKGFTLNKFALLAGLSSTTVKLGIRESKNVAVETAKKMADTLQCKIDDIFNRRTETKKYSSETLAKIVSIFKHMLSLAKRLQIIDNNYATAEYVRGITAEPRPKDIMDLDDALDTLECLEHETDLRAATAVMIGIYMGRRRGEVAGLQWPDLDLEYGDMDVKRSRSVVAGKGVIEKSPKSENSKKSYSMPPSLTRQLVKYKAWWDDHVENALGDRYQGVPYLFLQANGKPLHPSTIYKWWKDLQAKYNLKDVDFHSLRATNISVQYASNLIPSTTIAERAGHADDKVTKKRYQSLFKSDDRKTAMIVDEIFKRQTDTAQH